MVSLYAPPLNQLAAGLLVLIGLGSAWWGARRLARGLRDARSLEVVQGLRGLVIAVAAVAVAVGLLSGRKGFVVFGAVFLGEELYETGVLSAIIAWGERARQS